MKNLIKQDELNIESVNPILYNANLLFYLLKKIPATYEDNVTVNYFLTVRDKIVKLAEKKGWLNEVKTFLAMEYKTAQNEVIRTLLLHLFLALDRLEIKDKKGSNIDLAIFLEENKKDSNYLFNNDFYEEVLDFDNIQLGVASSIVELKNKYKFKEVFYSNEISPRNLLKQLVYTTNSLEEILLDFEMENPNYMGTKNKILCIGIGEEIQHQINASKS